MRTCLKRRVCNACWEIYSLSHSSVRIFCTYTRASYADKYTAGSGNILQINKIASGVDIFISTVEHVVSAQVTIKDFTYKLSHIFASTNVDAFYELLAFNFVWEKRERDEGYV